MTRLLLPLALLLSPAVKPQSEADDLRYRLRTESVNLRNKADELDREKAISADLKRQLDKSRESAAGVDKAISKQSAAAHASTGEMRKVAANIADQVKANNDSAVDRAAKLTAVGERAADSADKSAETAQTIRDRQLTQLWISILTAIAACIYGLTRWRLDKKTHDLVVKVETSSNGSMAALLASKDALFFAAQKAAQDVARKDEAIRLLLEKKIQMLEQRGAYARKPAIGKPKRDPRNSR